MFGFKPVLGSNLFGCKPVWVLILLVRRPISVTMSWLCVISSGVMLQRSEVALGGWAAVLATIGFVIQADLSYTRFSLPSATHRPAAGFVMAASASTSEQRPG
jgi:hypothetical protein